MDRLEAYRVFVAVAEAEGFAAAARSLGVSPQTVTRAVASLESHLGVLLLHRTTRVTRLTDAGRDFLPECRRALGTIEAIEAAVQGSQLEPRGRLRVTAPVKFGQMYVAPVLFDFLGLHPDLGADAVFVDRVVDMVDEGFDVAIRIGHLPDSSLTALSVGAVRRVVCASPSYLDGLGRPNRRTSLGRHRLIGFPPSLPLHGWDDLVDDDSRLTVNSIDVGIAAAVAGHGLLRALSYQVAPELKRRRLEILLRHLEPDPIPVHIVYPGGRSVAAKVRAFIDHAVPRLRRVLQQLPH